tara:strand:+ start:3524 stop:5032 length:1509 start_codon:yes stop_codon:yes gene_type:complete
MGNSGDPQSLDPHITAGYPEKKIHSGLFEGLVLMHPEDLSPIPGVAESWDVSEDGKTYTFHLRKEARWSNGAPLTAQDFLFSLERVLSPNISAPYAYTVFLLKNGQAYHNGTLTDFSKVGAKALDEHTLQLELENPTPYFLQMVSQHAWYPVHKATILKHGDPYAPNNPWVRPGNHVGNGPFALKEWRASDVIKIERNPHYWDKENVHLNEVHFFPMDPETEERAFRSNQLHYTYRVVEDKLRDLFAKEAPELVSTPSPIFFHFILNTQVPPLNDKRVRKALSLAINRKALTARITGPNDSPAYNFISPVVSNYTPAVSVKEDIQYAKALLAEAGYPNGEGFPQVELLYHTAEINRKLAQAIQEMWKKNLGINITLQNQEWKVVLANRAKKQFEILRNAWLPRYLDANASLALYTSDSTQNHTSWAHPGYDALLEQAAAANNPEERLSHLQAAEAILLEEVPIIPIYFINSNHFKHADIKGWYPNALDEHPYKFIYLENTPS